MKVTEKLDLDLCAKYGGKCCQGVYVTKREYELLDDEYKKDFDCKEFMNGYVSNGDRCSLGCRVSPIEPFLDCKLYPLEIVALDKLRVNEAAKQSCIAVTVFTTEEYYKRGYELLNEYVGRGILTQEDVDSLLKMEYHL